MRRLVAISMPRETFCRPGLVGKFPLVSDGWHESDSRSYPASLKPNPGRRVPVNLLNNSVYADQGNSPAHSVCAGSALAAKETGACGRSVCMGRNIVSPTVG